MKIPRRFYFSEWHPFFQGVAGMVLFLVVMAPISWALDWWWGLFFGVGK